VPRITREKLVAIAVLRALGFTQAEIAEKLGVRQEAVGYHLRKLRRVAVEQGPAIAFWGIVLGPLGAGAAAMKALEEAVEGRARRRGWGLWVEGG